MAGHQFATLPYLRTPLGGVRTQCRFHGSYTVVGMPVYVREYTILHALVLVLDYLEELGNAIEGARRKEISSGDSAACGRLSAWVVRSTWNFQPAA